MKQGARFLTGSLLMLLLAMPAVADGVASWSGDQWVQPKNVHNLFPGYIERFNQTVNTADVEYEDQGLEAAEYWGQEAQRASHSTVSYYIDLGDMYHRLGEPENGRAYYHFAHTFRRKTVEDNLELGMAFLDANRPGLADYYFKQSMRFARSKRDWLAISDCFTKLGNAKMAEYALSYSAKRR